jgi:hypothetical protein
MTIWRSSGPDGMLYLADLGNHCVRQVRNAYLSRKEMTSLDN